MTRELDKSVLCDVFDGEEERLGIRGGDGKEFLDNSTVEPATPGAGDAQEPLVRASRLVQRKVLDVESDLVIRSDHKNARLDEGVGTRSSNDLGRRNDEVRQCLLWGLQREHRRHGSILEESYVPVILHLVHWLIVRSLCHSLSHVHVSADVYTVITWSGSHEEKLPPVPVADQRV